MLKYLVYEVIVHEKREEIDTTPHILAYFVLHVSRITDNLVSNTNRRHYMQGKWWEREGGGEGLKDRTSQKYRQYSRNNSVGL